MLCALPANAGQPRGGEPPRVEGPAVTSESGHPAVTTFEPDLEIEPYGDGLAELTAQTIEWTGALPEYRAVLTDVRTGDRIPLRYGWADEAGDTLQGPYSVDTRAALPTNATYEFELRIRTVGFWNCSAHDPDGCSWFPGERSVHKWRFAWDGTSTKGRPAPPEPSTISLSPRTAWSARGWRVTATLRSGGKPLAGQVLVGRYRTTGGWKRDRGWRTNAKGRLTLNFRGEQTRTLYRFHYSGATYVKASKSRSVNITGRR